MHNNDKIHSVIKYFQNLLQRKKQKVILALQAQFSLLIYRSFINTRQRGITLEYILFFLNICLTVGMSTSVASAYFLNRVRGGKVFIALGFLFFIYLVDNTIVFMTEVIPSFAASYNTIFVSSPVFKAVLHIGMIYCYMYIHKQILRDKINSINYVLMFAYAMVIFTSNFTADGTVGA